MREVEFSIFYRLLESFRERHGARLMYTVGLKRNHWEEYRDNRKQRRVKRAEVLACIKAICMEESVILALDGELELARWLSLPQTIAKLERCAREWCVVCVDERVPR